MSFTKKGDALDHTSTATTNLAGAVFKMRQGGQDDVVVFPSEPEPESEQQATGVKNFHRIEGEFVVPSDAEVLLVEVKLLQDGSVRAKQSVTL